MPDRREFLGHVAAVGLGATIAGNAATVNGATANASAKTDQFCAFTESFQDWPIPKVCERFRDIGLDGLDLTVRPGGHIEPTDAVSTLPSAAKAAKENGVAILMLSTAITDDSKLSEQILATAADAGIDRVKLGYFRYSAFGKLMAELDEARRQLERIARLGEKHKILPCVHIHSGPTIPGNGPLAYLLLREFSTKEIGAYADPMHMTIEGGNDGWRQGLDLLTPWIAISSLKNAAWHKKGRDEHGQERWATLKCPLADGIAPIPDYLATLRLAGYRGLFTLHSEYKDRNSWKQLTTDECLEQTKQDLLYTQSILKHKVDTTRSP